MPLNLRDLPEDPAPSPTPTPTPTPNNAKPALNLRDLPPDEAKDDNSIPGIKSYATGLNQSLSGNYFDEGIAHKRALTDKIMGSPEPYWDLYRKHQKDLQDFSEEAQRQHPTYYGAGQLTGDAALMASPGGALLAPEKSAGVAYNMAKMGVVGGVYASGGSRGNIDTPEDQAQLAKDTGIGMLVGAGTEGAIQGGGEIASSLKPANLDKFAADRAAKASGAMTGDINKMLDKGQYYNYGKQLLDNDVVTAGSTVKDINQRVQNFKDNSGKKIGDAVQKTDDLIKDTIEKIKSGEIFNDPASKESIVQNFGRPLNKDEMADQVSKNYQFSMENVADRIQNELIAPNQGVPSLSGEVQKLQKLADGYREMGSVPAALGQREKTALRETTNLNSDTIPQKFRQKVGKIVTDELDTTIGKTASLVDLNQGKSLIGHLPTEENQSIQSDFRDANRDYAAAKTAEKLSKKGMSREASNRQMSLTDYIMAGSSAAATASLTHDPVKTLAMTAATAGANKLARKYGPSIQASTAYNLSKFIKTLPETIQNSPDALKQAAQNGIIPLSTAQQLIDGYQQTRNEDDDETAKAQEDLRKYLQKKGAP